MHPDWRSKITCCYFLILLLSFMSHICTGCNVGYPLLKGLERHESQCILKVEQQIIPENAYDIFIKKKECKQQEALELKRRKLPSNLPLFELPYVCRFPCPNYPNLTTSHSHWTPLIVKQTWTSARISFRPRKWKLTNRVHRKSPQLKQPRRLPYY